MRYFLIVVFLALLAYNDFQLFKAIHGWLVGSF